MADTKFYEDEWYVYLKRKYDLSDDDMEEYIDSFESINKGKPISPNILADFINDEVRGEIQKKSQVSSNAIVASSSDLKFITVQGNDYWTITQCKNIIKNINLKVTGKERQNLDLYTYLRYIIPICQEFVINKIGIREFFDSLDTDQNGFITCKELISVLYKVNKNFTPEDIEKHKLEIKKLCKKVDINGDGYLSYDEFSAFMNDKILKSK